MKKNAPKHGGARAGAGRPPVAEKKKQYTIYLRPSDVVKIEKKYGSLAEALSRALGREPF